MSDPICRVQNPYPNNVVKLVHNLPHSEMSNDAFKEYMKSCEYGYDRFFKTYYQLACQLGLYYIDAENNYHPRFFNDINEEQANLYLINWFSKYYVPNPYTRGFELLKNPILVEDTLYEYIKKYGNSKQILEICQEIFKEEIGNPDIFINAINSYSRKIKISNNKFEIKDFKEGSMETGNNRDDKKAFFDTFSKDNGTDKLPFPHNRIIFGAPGTGKSKKLSADFEKYFLTCLNSSDLHKQLYDEIHSQPTDADQAEWITALGIRYATYITEKYINPKKQNELIDDFDLLNNGEQTTKKKEQLVQGAKAAYRLHLNDKLLCYKTRGERVTFHPNYSYAQFVGTYKPVQDSADENQIKYEYIPGPFLRIYTAAKQNPSQNFLLLIEEINRANVAAVFGDVFQLLDRDENGNSEYPIAASEDIKKYLTKNGIHEDELKIPSNMYIWATMNSADQGVFPMDTAFKRRWEFEYIGIDDAEKKADGTVDETFASYTLPVPSKQDNDIKYIPIKWNVIRHAINNKLKEISGVNEDKLLGPYFLSKALLEKSTKVSAEDSNEEKTKICSSFKSKVLMYLYEDVVKMNPTELFNKEIFPDGKPLHYSALCLKFDEVGLEIFGKDFIKES